MADEQRKPGRQSPARRVAAVVSGDMASAAIPPLATEIGAGSADAVFEALVGDGLSAAHAAADASKKEATKMASVADQVTTNGAETAQAGAERAQAMFGEAGERAKSAFEKSSKLMDEMIDLARGNVEAVVASSRAAAKGAETMFQDASENARKSFEKAQSTARSYAAVKSPTEFLQLHNEFARAQFDEAVSGASKFSETYVKLMSDVFEPITARFQAAADKIRSAAL